MGLILCCLIPEAGEVAQFFCGSLVPLSILKTQPLFGYLMVLMFNNMDVHKSSVKEEVRNAGVQSSFAGRSSRRMV